MLAVVVTNQSGVARGLFDEAFLQALHRHMGRLFAAQGALIDAFYYCPHHPTAGKGAYLKACNCRKPEPGMLLQAARDWGIDLERSYTIGDMAKDVLAGQRTGGKGVLLGTASSVDDRLGGSPRFRGGGCPGSRPLDSGPGRPEAMTPGARAALTAGAILVVVAAVLAGRLALQDRSAGQPSAKASASGPDYRMRMEGLSFHGLYQGRRVLGLSAASFVVRKKRMGFLTFSVAHEAHLENAAIDLYLIRRGGLWIRAAG